jgi:ribosomal protein S18 acetylase RimI-like enzyme
MQVKIERGDTSCLKDISKIEEESLENPLTEDKLEQLIYGMGAGILVAKYGKKTIGYLAYQEAENEEKEKLFVICSILVRKEYRRKKIATKLVDQLKEISRNQANVLISELNLELQLFFKAIGFVAVEIYSEFFGDKHDAYHFIYLKEKDRKEFQDSLCGER